MTLGRMARAAGLARASLLHYEALGLLRPAARSAAGYRLYGPAELARLENIRRLREAGLSLAAIGELLTPAATAPPQAAAALLEARLLALCCEMEQLRQQQQQLARLLAAPEFRSGAPLSDKAAWVELLRRAGFDDVAMRKWHAGFEADDPAGHTAFLQALNLRPAEISAIRRWSRSVRKSGA